MAKIAFILLCHKDPDAIIQQAAFAKMQTALADNPNVVFAKKRIKCGWGEWSLVQATLYAVEAAVDAFPRATHFYMVHKSAGFMRRSGSSGALALRARCPQIFR